MTNAKNLRGEMFAEFNRPVNLDRRLFAADVRVSLVYCDALFHAGVLTRLESERIKNGLQTILKRAEFDSNYFDDSAANVHALIETRLVQLIGEAGEKIKIGRSRYDQSVTAFRLCVREEIEAISKSARDLQTVLIEAGERNKQAVLPAYANRRKVQPILWAHWCLAYFEMFSRDRERLDEVWRRVNVLPLGAGVLAGTSIEIDREEIAGALGFEGVLLNSLDAVSDRDFAVEFIGACSLLMIHLSRLAEDLTLYSSEEFGFIEQNSENLETIRGKTGEIFGHQLALLSSLKNLPLGVYHNLQEIETAIFDTIDSVKFCLAIAKSALQNLRLNESKTLEAATTNYLNANELIDYLIQRDVPLKDTRKIIGDAVSYASAQKKELNELSLNELRQFSENIGDDVFEALSLENALAAKNQIGGTSPERVYEALEQARTEIEQEEND